MEREGRGRGENFVNKERLNIVARSVAAISIAAAGVAAAEKSGLFDPLDSVGSANHLVLSNLHNSYEQLIDNLPKAEKAEALSTMVITIGCSRDGLNHLHVSGSVVTDAAPPVGINAVAIALKQTNNPAVTASGATGANGNYDIANAPAGFIEENVTYKFTKTGYDDINDNFECAIGKSVGGISELPNVKALPQDTTSEKSNDNTVPIAAGIAAAGAITAAAAALYIRRNRPSR